MNRLNKSHSNPSKLSHFHIISSSGGLMPRTTRTNFSKSPSSTKLNKSLSSHSKKFGIRQLSNSPGARDKPKPTQQAQQSITINTVNMNLLIQEKTSSKLVSPHLANSTRNRVTKQFLNSKVNYFKAAGGSKFQKKKDAQRSEVNRSKPKKSPFNFEPIKKLANGQYGGLYLAYSKETNFHVVLKAFNKQKVTLDFMIDQFKIQMYCQHPNILPAYGFFLGKTEVYLIMEAGSHNLYTEIKKAGHFSEKKSLSYIYQVMKGLSYLHLNGIIHRDIKPENIIISGGVLKISDFGWSAITYADRRTFCGTLDYLSPQVAKGDKYDSKIDSWSVGVLFYEMMTGFPPYEKVEDERERKPSLDYTTPIVFPANISEDCQKFIKRFLTKDPTKRPTIVEALRDPWLIETISSMKKKNAETKPEISQFLGRK